MFKFLAGLALGAGIYHAWIWAYLEDEPEQPCTPSMALSWDPDTYGSPIYRMWADSI